jgi:mRNA-degrading endonuclease RelE of RelBE toxin-antitoxin system
MDFRIADTFTDSLARLTGEEQKAVKTTAFDLQLNPANPGMSFHKLDKARDKNFWSVRVNSDIRLIVHKGDTSLLLCYVGHHDKAYDWAERRKLETHPKTGAAQLVEIRETVKEIFIPVYLNRQLTERCPEYERFPFHNLRHLHAVEWLQSGRSIYDLQHRLGHTSLKTTEMYLEFLTPEEKRVSQGVSQKVSQGI